MFTKLAATLDRIFRASIDWYKWRLRAFAPFTILKVSMELPRSPALAEQLQAFEQRCRDRGITLTVQRRTIAESVLQRHDHPTADQIYEDVKTRAPEISRATVYRTLETLVEMGAIQRAHYLGPSSRFDANVG